MGGISPRPLYAHETYSHASDPEQKCMWSPCRAGSSMSYCVAHEEKIMAYSVTSASDWHDQDTMVHEHDAAEINAITSSYCTKLTFIRESMHHHLYSQASYQQLLELLGVLGTALPVEEIVSILLDVLKSGDCHFIMVLRHFLFMHQMNLDVEPGETTMLRDIIYQSLKMLHDVIRKGSVNPSLTSAFQASRTVLEYFLKVFTNDVNGELDKSVLARVLSATKWSWYDEILDAAFALLELNCSSQSVFFECVDILLGLALVPIGNCNSKVEQEELCTSLAEQLSKRIALLPDSFRKYFVLIRIPSEHVRLKVVDFHLDRYFAATTDTTVSGITDSSFVSKFKMHLQKTVVGTKHDLGYFLSLLTMLLQSHLLVVSGVPMVSFISDQHTPVDRSPQLQSPLAALNQPVTAFINRLSTHPDTASFVITPTNWYYLELLIILTS